MDYLFCILIIGVSALLSWPLGFYLKNVMAPESSQGLSRERFLAIFLGKSIHRPQGWKAYTVSLLAFNALMFLFVYGVLALQQFLCLNPDQKGALEPSLVFNTALSFTTNTNLQHYSGEVSLSYLSQIGALMWLQFVSAATGIAALAAIARALSGKAEIGNFFQDLARATFFVLLPLAIIFGTLLVLTGVPMTWSGSAVAHTLEGLTQTIARGPVAAFVAIKQLGTNGGGFFGPNSTHPFENPSFYSNIIEMVAILIIPMASVWLFGRVIGKIKHAQMIFGLMLVLLATKAGFAVYLEHEPATALQTVQTVEQPSGNLEGKELRFGTATGPLWSVLTTSTSNGSVGAMHNSLNPLTLLLPFAGMWLNVTFGGVGVGMINFFLFIVLAVFISGLMVGRSPEYLGKKIETREMKLASLAILAHPIFILGGTALFATTEWGRSTINNPGFRGFAEMLYEFSSAAANNGSGLEGLGDNTVAWNIATGLVMLFGRFLPIIFPLAIAGSLAKKSSVAESVGTLSTDRWPFAVVLIGTILLVGALLFLPVAVLGPIAESLGGING